MCRVLKASQESGQDFVGTFRRFHADKNAFEVRDAMYAPSENGFNTLCHGDCWFNNMMFK